MSFSYKRGRLVQTRPYLSPKSQKKRRNTSCFKPVRSSSIAYAEPEADDPDKDEVEKDGKDEDDEKDANDDV